MDHVDQLDHADQGEWSADHLRALGKALLDGVTYAELLRSSRTLIGRPIRNRVGLTKKFSRASFMKKFKEAVGPEDFEKIEAIIREKKAVFKGEHSTLPVSTRIVPNVRIFDRPTKAG